MGGRPPLAPMPQVRPLPPSLVPLEDTLKTLHARVFDANHPEKFREALAAMLEDLAR